MDGFTLLILLALAFWAGWIAHWIATRKQRRLLKRYGHVLASLGEVIPQRIPKRATRRRGNGR